MRNRIRGRGGEEGGLAGEGAGRGDEAGGGGGEGAEAEPVGVRLTRDEVLGVGPGAPTVIAADALLAGIEVEDGSLAVWQFEGVGGVLEVVGGVGEGVDAEGGEALGEEAEAAAVADRDPAGVDLVAGFAGFDVIGEELLADGAGIASDAGVAAVLIGLMRPGAEPSETIEAGWEGHLEAEAREFWEGRVGGLEGGLDEEVTRAEEFVGGQPGGLDGGEGEFGADAQAMGFGLLGLELAQLGVLVGVAPEALGLGHIASAVVVGGGPPEVRSERFLDELGAVEDEGGEGAVMAVEGGGEVGALGDDLGGALGDVERG